MKKIISLITILSLCLANDGTISGVTYFDYTNSEDVSSFNFKRQYFNYSIKKSDDLKFKVVFDVGNTGKIDGEDNRLDAFLKKAQIDYNCDWWKTSLGVIGTNTYGVQEKNWGYRFIEKSPLDLNGFASTADLGIGISKTLPSNLHLSLQFVNGEGFSKPQSDKHHKTSLNVTYGESNILKNAGYNAGIAYSTEDTDVDPITMTSVFGGYAADKFRFGLEYDMLSNNGAEHTLTSFTSNFKYSDKINVFARYDLIDDNNEDAMNGENFLIAGLTLDCGNGFIIAPNVRVKSFEDEAIDSENEYKISFQFKF